ncbi:ATP synthase subunit B family protein [endosymbiont of unidentified scaly snail isolate Monju]|uniref:hypothetical protein n=1 Tax=endosymbiont of unidentified scaly snail isolate Monju TaxID=1248727 RepID=UPI00038924A6|nr:hypothetical protein [endosymbiont of unidentified scaly snail isolate Monju]BAN68747.1 hypothetical protein EBS_0804 [endosymbiont of unidentified scaly snail isolate Monju]
MNDGFTDLRLNRQEDQVNESFWPSFTDIMTTVVMIFLIALVVLLVRNMELVRQLRATMEAERIAAELARATGEEKDSLSMALHRTEAELRQARLEILHLREKAVDREKVITDQIATINRLTEARDALERKYLVLVGDYDNLKVKYDKLVRPARSPAGRHVVEVRYWKEGGQYRIAWHEGDKGEFQPISRKHLDRVLSRLLKQHPNGLYVKVIFPENSGLSYNEAWEFTNHLHRNYDYYFRDDGKAARDAPRAGVTGGE